DVCRVRLSIVCCLSFFGGYRVSRPLHSFPTRRSSDLVDRSLFPRAEGPCEQSPRLTADPGVQVLGRPRTVQALDRLIRLADAFLDVGQLQPEPRGQRVQAVSTGAVYGVPQQRSEEHTSE